MPRATDKKEKKDKAAKPIPGTSEPVAQIETPTTVTPVFKAGDSEAQPSPAKKIQKLDPLGPGQAYFEAPDGTILIGEDSREQIWYRAGNNGKGMWVNKKR